MIVQAWPARLGEEPAGRDRSLAEGHVVDTSETETDHEALRMDAESTVADEAATEHETWWTRFQETLEIANINAAPEMIIAGTFAATEIPLRSWVL